VISIPAKTGHERHSAPDVICVLGRGIEQVRTNSGERWRPTRYIEAVDENGCHTGCRRREVNINDDYSLVAGANANVLALCQRWRECALCKHRPSVVVFAAGRPAYLSRTEPFLTEGLVLSEAFRRRTGARGCEMLILAQNRNTRDDILECARIADGRKLREIEVITVSVHLPRTAEFARLAHSEMPQARFHLIASEDVLRRRYLRFARFPVALEEAQKSRAYLRTEAREAAGIRALRSGEYRYV
jgi:hypothetical protein